MPDLRRRFRLGATTCPSRLQFTKRKGYHKGNPEYRCIMDRFQSLSNNRFHSWINPCFLLPVIRSWWYERKLFCLNILKSIQRSEVVPFQCFSHHECIDVLLQHPLHRKPNRLQA